MSATGLSQEIELEIELLLPEVEDERDACVGRLQTQLAAVRGISTAHVATHGGKPKLCLHYDPSLVSFDAVDRQARRVGAQITDQFHHNVLPITGMDCSDCTAAIGHAVSRIDGVLAASVSYVSQQLRVEYDGSRTNRAAIIHRVEAMGYVVPRNGVNLLAALLVLLLGCAIHLAFGTPAWFLGVAVVVAMWYLAWLTFRDVRFVRSELKRRMERKGNAMRLVMVIAGQPDGNEFPFARRQARMLGERFGVEVERFFLRDRMSPLRLLRARRELKELKNARSLGRDTAARLACLAHHSSAGRLQGRGRARR